MCTLMVSKITHTVHQSVKPHLAKVSSFDCFISFSLFFFTTAAALETNGISGGDQEIPQVIKYIKKLLVICMF